MQACSSLRLTACAAQGRQASSCLARSPGGQPRCSCRARTFRSIARPRPSPRSQRAGPCHRTRPRAPARSAAAARALQTRAPGRRQRAVQQGRGLPRPAAPALGMHGGPRGAAHMRSCRQGAPRPARAAPGRGWAARGRGRAPGRPRRAAWRWRRARWAPCWPPPRSSRTPRRTGRVPASACTCHAVAAAACFTARGVQRVVRAARAVQGQAAALRRGKIRFTLPPASRRPCAAMAPTKHGRAGHVGAPGAGAVTRTSAPACPPRGAPRAQAGRAGRRWSGARTSGWRSSRRTRPSWSRCWRRRRRGWAWRPRRPPRARPRRARPAGRRPSPARPSGWRRRRPCRPVRIRRGPAALAARVLGGWFVTGSCGSGRLCGVP